MKSENRRSSAFISVQQKGFKATHPEDYFRGVLCLDY